MPRPATAGFDIAQLERILQDRKTEVNRLERLRSELQRSSTGWTGRSRSSRAGSRPPRSGAAAVGRGLETR